MAETGKKVEVRYGAFACRVEGFDDPVATLRDVISLMQRMIAETPAMADRHAALDDALVARIGDALAGRRATEDAMHGIVVIRNDEAIATDRESEVEEAEILAPRRQDAADAAPRHPVTGRTPTGGPDGDPDVGAEDRHAPGPAPADAGPHPSAALYAAPAAAAAEAAFAATVAAATELPGDETDSQAPLGVAEPEDAATSAALFAAPAAAVADAAFASGRASPAPADAAAGKAERPRADAAAGDAERPRADAAAGETGPPGADAAPGELEAPWGDVAAGYAEPPWADAAEATSGRAGIEIVASSDADQAGAAPEALRRGRGPGGPGEGWAPWGSGPGGAAAAAAGAATEAVGGAADGTGTPSPTVSSADRASGVQEHILPQGFRDPAPDYEETEEDLIPGFNIFAPPPDPDPAIAGSPGAFPAGAGGPASPLPLGRGSGPHAVAPGPDAGPSAALAPAREMAEGPDPAPAPSAGGSAEDAADDFTDRSADAPDEALDDGAGDWLDAADDGVDDPDNHSDAHRSAENRLAALITRYQSGRHGAAAREPVSDRAAGAISAAELAERAGATEVDTLLAASAAWLTLADGRARFTRREVMEVFETLPGDHPRTLEARIKGFGTLVRSGALRLVDDGAFALAPRERARFRALIDQG